MSGAWVLDLHVREGVMHLVIADREAKQVHSLPLPAAWRGEIGAALHGAIAEFGAPDQLLTDHSVVFSGIGEALGIPQTYCPASSAWLERKLRRLAA